MLMRICGFVSLWLRISCAISEVRDEYTLTDQYIPVIQSYFMGLLTVRVFHNASHQFFGSSTTFAAKVHSMDQPFLRQLDDMGDGTNNPAMGIGYLVLANSVDTVSHNIEWFSRINTNAKWLIVAFDPVSPQRVYNMLWQAWQQNNMLNLIILNMAKGFYIHPFADDLKEVTFDADDTFTNFSYFETRSRHLNGYPLKTEAVSIRSKHFLDVVFHVFDDVLAFFVQYLNATTQETEHMVDIEFRSVDSKGRFVGPMKLINESRIEISTNDRFLADYGKSNVGYLYPLKAVELFYLVHKRPNETPSVFFMIFDGAARYLELIFLVVAVCSWSLCETRKHWSFSKTVLNLFGVLCGVSITTPCRDRLARRLVMAVCLFHALIINSAYQGHITRELSSPGKTVNIQTIQELLATNYSLHNSLPANTLYADTDNSSDIAKLARRSVLMNTEEMRELFRYKTNIAVLLKDFCADLVLTRNFDNQTGEDRSHKIPQAPVAMLSAYIVRKDSAFLTRFIDAELRAVETGFVNVAVQKILFHNKMLYLRRFRDGSFVSTTERHQITMENIKGLVNACLLLYGTAVLVFVLEIFLFNAKQSV